jgi:hypothetical protein
MSSSSLYRSSGLRPSGFAAVWPFASAGQPTTPCDFSVAFPGWSWRFGTGSGSRSELRVLPSRRHPAIELLRSWLDEDEQEQRETWEVLRRALGTDRPSDRKLF